MNIYLDTKITLNVMSKKYKNNKIHKKKYKSVENNKINIYKLITIH